jgi:hypothetical protein
VTKDSSFEVSFSLPPAVRPISRSPRQSAPAVPVEPKYTRLPRITEVLGLALQFQEMIDRGEVCQHADLARLGCVSRERISQIMILTWLAPDIQEEILRLPPSPRGRSSITELALRELARLPTWQIQRQRWRRGLQDQLGSN